MRRDLSSFLVVTAVAVQAAASGEPQQPPSGNVTPTNASAPAPQDPAAVVFTTEAGLVLHAVKPGSEGDYEAAILALKEALAASADADTQKVASGWRVFKAAEPDAKANVIYVHWLDPAVAGIDYRPSLWLDRLLAGAPADMLAKYRDAFAMPPTKLSLVELPRK